MKQLIILTFISLLTGCFSRHPVKTGLEGKELPPYDFILDDSITHINMSSIKSGKPFVLFFFGPNCPYSHSQMKEFVEEIEKLKNIQIYLLTIYPFAQMKQFQDHYQLKKYPNIITGLDYTRSFDDYFKVPGFPYIVVFGKDKKLRSAFIGKINSWQIKEVAEK